MLCDREAQCGVPDCAALHVMMAAKPGLCQRTAWCPPTAKAKESKERGGGIADDNRTAWSPLFFAFCLSYSISLFCLLHRIVAGHQAVSFMSMVGRHIGLLERLTQRTTLTNCLASTRCMSKKMDTADSKLSHEERTVTEPRQTNVHEVILARVDQINRSTRLLRLESANRQSGIKVRSRFHGCMCIFIVRSV